MHPYSEAGEGHGGQRRYLWTDAFGVLNLTAFAARSRMEGDAPGRSVVVTIFE